MSNISRLPETLLRRVIYQKMQQVILQKFDLVKTWLRVRFDALKVFFFDRFFRQKRRMIGRLASIVSRLPGKLLMLVNCHISKSAADNSSETLFSKDLAKGSFSCLKSLFRNSIFLRILHIYLIKMFLVLDPRLEA